MPVRYKGIANVINILYKIANNNAYAHSHSNILINNVDAITDTLMFKISYAMNVVSLVRPVTVLPTIVIVIGLVLLLLLHSHVPCLCWLFLEYCIGPGRGKSVEEFQKKIRNWIKIKFNIDTFIIYLIFTNYMHEWK